jgi:crotonobetainyl-CoA:carnitine CoA-transferase CaiB-like acyl-CoA transferase
MSRMSLPTRRSRNCGSSDPSHPRLGELDLIAQPCEITGFDRNLRSATPDLGEHNDEVLRSLGYDAEGIEKLKAAKAI